MCRNASMSSWAAPYGARTITRRATWLALGGTWFSPGGHCLAWHARHARHVLTTRTYFHALCFVISLQSYGKAEVGAGRCRLWHADVLEWVWFLNSYPEVMYRTMYGDKDTFRIAFHLAGKAEMFSQVRVWPQAVLPKLPIGTGLACSTLGA